MRKVLQPFFFPFSITSDEQLFEGSDYPTDCVIRPDDETLLVLFEFKNEESPSYFQAQVSRNLCAD